VALSDVIPGIRAIFECTPMHFVAGTEVLNQFTDRDLILVSEACVTSVDGVVMRMRAAEQRGAERIYEDSVRAAEGTLGLRLCEVSCEGGVRASRSGPRVVWLDFTSWGWPPKSPWKGLDGAETKTRR